MLKLKYYPTPYASAGAINDKIEADEDFEDEVGEYAMSFYSLKFESNTRQITLSILENRRSLLRFVRQCFRIGAELGMPIVRSMVMGGFVELLNKAEDKYGPGMLNKGVKLIQSHGGGGQLCLASLIIPCSLHFT